MKLVTLLCTEGNAIKWGVKVSSVVLPADAKVNVHCRNTVAAKMHSTLEQPEALPALPSLRGTFQLLRETSGCVLELFFSGPVVIATAQARRMHAAHLLQEPQIAQAQSDPQLQRCATISDDARHAGVRAAPWPLFLPNSGNAWEIATGCPVVMSFTLSDGRLRCSRLLSELFHRAGALLRLLYSEGSYCGCLQRI